MKWSCESKSGGPYFDTQTTTLSASLPDRMCLGKVI